MNDGTAKASARRRLIRGVFAAPAALTLFSGSVAAGSLSCVAAVVNHPPVNPMNVDGTSTSILRVPLRVFVETGTTDVVLAKFVSGDDLKLLFPDSLTNAEPYLKPGSWECVDAMNEQKFTPGTEYTSKEIADAGYTADTALSSEYVAVRVGADGNVIGVQGFSDEGSAMFVSCWCSFGGEAPFNGM